MGQYMDFMEEEEETVGRVHWGQIEEGTKDDETEKQTKEMAKPKIDLQQLLQIICNHT